MGLIDELRAAGEQASSRARETVRATQLKHDLERAYGELGHAAYALLEDGTISHPRLEASGERLRSLERQVVDLAGDTQETSKAPRS